LHELSKSRKEACRQRRRKLAAASVTTRSNIAAVNRPVFVFWREQ
jgi:hypothetical protein